MANTSWLKIGCTYDMAKEYGIEEGIVLDYFIYEIHQKAVNGSNFYDGKNWTYNTHDALLTRLPFPSRKPLMRVLKSLEDCNMIVKGNYNKHSYDRTCWYTLSDKCAEKYGVKFASKEELKEARSAKNNQPTLSETGQAQVNQSTDLVPNGTKLIPKPDEADSQTGQPIPSSSPSPFTSSSSSKEWELVTTTTFSFPLENPQLIMQKYNCTELEARKAFDKKCKEKGHANNIGLFISKKVTVPEFEKLIEDWDNEYNQEQQRLKDEQDALERKRQREQKDYEFEQLLIKANPQLYGMNISA